VNPSRFSLKSNQVYSPIPFTKKAFLIELVGIRPVISRPIWYQLHDPFPPDGVIIANAWPDSDVVISSR
jgi:hypothetical protein